MVGTAQVVVVTGTLTTVTKTLEPLILGVVLRTFWFSPTVLPRVLRAPLVGALGAPSLAGGPLSVSTLGEL